MTLLLAVTLALGAALLFGIQPMFGKLVLPVLGGAPAVWITALVFFQAVVLAGYVYAHLLTRVRPPRLQVLIHAVVLGAGFLSLPIEMPQGWSPPASAHPVGWLLALLVAVLGIPLLAVAATAPLVQRWLSYSRHEGAADPYFLYGASNAGALVALLAYPFVVEPMIGLAAQARVWAIGFGALTVLVGASAWGLLREGAGRDAASAAQTASVGRVGWARRLHWTALACVPSTMLAGVTLHISTDVAAVPFLWAIPLALFVLSFVLAFARRQPFARGHVLEFQAVVFVALAIYFSTQDLWLVFGLHLLALFATAVVCHRELALRRPAPEHLTEFYLWMSVGGLAGGILAAVVAPLVFDTVLEYPLAIVAACLLRPAPGGRRILEAKDLLLPAGLAAFCLLPGLDPRLHPASYGSLGPLAFFAAIAVALHSWRHRPIRLALGMAIMVLAMPGLIREEPALLRERSFFGVHAVRASRDGAVHILRHGTTVHGAQAIATETARLPLTYYNLAGPLGQVMRVRRILSGTRHIGVVGLGTGALACYRRRSQTLTFYEIDPVIVRIARDPRYFRYLELCSERTRIEIGDGRTGLARAEDHRYGILVLDAFSSDAIPVHLLTREAFALYVRKLAPRGVLLVHVSNRYVDLAPVVALLASDAGLIAYRQQYRPSEAEALAGGFESDWIVVARSADDLAELGADSRWMRLEGDGTGAVWTDDFANLFSALDWRRLLWTR